MKGTEISGVGAGFLVAQADRNGPCASGAVVWTWEPEGGHIVDHAVCSMVQKSPSDQDVGRKTVFFSPLVSLTWPKQCFR